MVGPGKPIDTDRFFVICANVLGGCMGTTGPAEIDPATGKPYALTFPLVTVRDMVRAQAMLLDALGIEKLLCVTGGSMGGMQVLQWAASYPERVVSAMPIATAARHSAQNIAFHEVGRQAIMADPDWRGGAYQACRHAAVKGARGGAHGRAHHLSLGSRAAAEIRTQRCRTAPKLSFAFAPDFQVESYLHHQGSSFVDRFDANSYLYITRAMDYFDLAADYGGVLAERVPRSARRASASSPSPATGCFRRPRTSASRTRSNAAGATVSFVEIETDRGHDAFLLDEPELFATARRFLNSVARSQGVT